MYVLQAEVYRARLASLKAEVDGKGGSINTGKGRTRALGLLRARVNLLKAELDQSRFAVT